MAKSPMIHVHATAKEPKNLEQMAEIFDGIKAMIDAHYVDPAKVSVYHVKYGDVQKIEFYWTTPATV